MDTATVVRAIRMYGLEPVAVQPMLSGYRNESYPVKLVDGQLVNLILYKHEVGIQARIQRINMLSAYLKAQNLPVRYPVDRRIMEIQSPSGMRYAALYNFVPGSTIPWEAYTKAHITLLGQSLAELHRAMRSYDTAAYLTVTNEYSEILGRMTSYFSDPNVKLAMTKKLQLAVLGSTIRYFSRILAAASQLPGQQVLHMDFVRSNILFTSDPVQITGILDFEKATVGHPLFDVARTLAFLLVDCKYKPEAKVRKYFLESGYRKHGSLRLERVAIRTKHDRRPLLEALVDLFLLYDFYKFLRHNPYESLPENEHFTRTRDLLLSRDVITTTSFNGQA